MTTSPHAVHQSSRQRFSGERTQWILFMLVALAAIAAKWLGASDRDEIPYIAGVTVGNIGVCLVITAGAGWLGSKFSGVKAARRIMTGILILLLIGQFADIGTSLSLKRRAKESRLLGDMSDGLKAMAEGKSTDDILKANAKLRADGTKLAEGDFSPEARMCMKITLELSEGIVPLFKEWSTKAADCSPFSPKPATLFADEKKSDEFIDTLTSMKTLSKAIANEYDNLPAKFKSRFTEAVQPSPAADAILMKAQTSLAKTMPLQCRLFLAYEAFCEARITHARLLSTHRDLWTIDDTGRVIYTDRDLFEKTGEALEKAEKQNVEIQRLSDELRGIMATQALKIKQATGG